MVIQKAIQIQKNRSNANKRAEMKQWILKCILRKESVGIRKDLPEDILGYALSNNKINQTEYDICREFEKLYNQIWQPNVKAINYNPIKKGEMPEPQMQLIKQKLEVMNKLLFQNQKKVVNTIIYGHLPPTWKIFKKYISPLYRL